MSGKPSSSPTASSTVPRVKCSRTGTIVGDLDLPVALCSEPVLDNRVLLSLCTLFLLCPSSSHPLLPKLPRRMSDSAGALETASPVADHMPEGRLDSMNFMDALRRRPEAPDAPRGRPVL